MKVSLATSTTAAAGILVDQAALPAHSKMTANTDEAASNHNHNQQQPLWTSTNTPQPKDKEDWDHRHHASSFWMVVDHKNEKDKSAVDDQKDNDADDDYHSQRPSSQSHPQHHHRGEKLPWFLAARRTAPATQGAGRGPLLSSNRAGATTIPKVCDPSSMDPDVGVLSCDGGYECVPDNDQETSPFGGGGHCLPSWTPFSSTPVLRRGRRTRRNLQAGAVCRLCHYGTLVGGSKHGTLLTAAGFEDRTCGDLYHQSYTYDDFDSETCLAASAVVQEAGCCMTYGDCNICGSGSSRSTTSTSNNVPFLNDAVIVHATPPTTCGDVQRAMNQSVCEMYSKYLYPDCCDYYIPATGSLAAGASANNKTKGLSSASNDWSSRSNLLVSIISLSSVTALGALVLN